MPILWQTEWCPSSQRVRQRLTELGVDVVLRQVAAEPGERADLQRRFGAAAVPVLEVENGCTVAGADDILAWLDEHYEPRPDALAHRERARHFAAARFAALHVERCALPPGIR